MEGTPDTVDGVPVDVPADVPADVVDTMRRFNRSFTGRIGVLDDSFLESGRPLGPNRLLFEIGGAGASVLDLRSRLGLDSGYVSRLLRRLEDDELVEVVADPADGRRRVVHLTPAGRSAWDDLDRRSDRLVERLVDPLTPVERTRLAAALETADRLLGAGAARFAVVDPRSDVALASMTAYFAELRERFSDGFEPGDTLVADAPSMTAPHGSFLIATIDGAPVACGGVQRHDASTGEIKRMWVHRSWRGAGLGRRMLAGLEDEVVRLGHDRVLLDTNDALTEAIAMYARAGYEPTERYNDNPYARCWFIKHLG